MNDLSVIQKFVNLSDIYNVSSNLIFDLCDTDEKTSTFRYVINTHHAYMSYKDTCNRRLNWLLYESSSGNLIGGVGINSAILSLSTRDVFIGWTKNARLKHLNKLANNYRFCLIKNNITEENVGTRVLKELRRISQIEWKSRYGDELVFLETLIKPPWTGTVYKADNWIFCGKTKGFSFSKAPLKLWQKENTERGKLAREYPDEAVKKYAVGNKMYNIQPSEPKLVYVKPLRKDWKKILTA